MTGPPVHKARSFKGNASEDFAVEELVQIPDLNPIEHLWDELQLALSPYISKLQAHKLPCTALFCSRAVDVRIY